MGLRSESSMGSSLAMMSVLASGSTMDSLSAHQTMAQHSGWHSEQHLVISKALLSEPMMMGSTSDWSWVKRSVHMYCPPGLRQRHD